MNTQASIDPMDMQALDLSSNAQAVLRTLISMAVDGKVRGATIAEIRLYGDLPLAGWRAGIAELVARGFVSRRRAGPPHASRRAF